MRGGGSGIASPSTSCEFHSRAPLAQPSMRVAQRLLALVVVLLALAEAQQSTVNTDAKAKSKAKAAAKKAYEEEHGTVFDSYGRVMKWGKKVTALTNSAVVAGVDDV